MNFKFDIYNRLETPQLALCELSTEKICTLYATHISMDLNYTDISEINFSIPKLINGEKYDYYDNVVELRLIYIQDIGYFQIDKVEEKSNGIETYKNCVAYSAEVMFQSKRITNIEGEYKLYDPVQPYNSIMGMLLLLAPDWKIGTVDGKVLSRQRSLKITEKDLYNIMVNDFYTIYSCIFVFDYNRFEINIYDAEKIFKNTEIFMSYHNLLKNTKVNVQTENIITALRVVGGDGLDISGINPNGTDMIYNVDYFKNRMSEKLRKALDLYEDKYSTLKPQYSNLIVEYKNKNIELSKLQSNAPIYSLSFVSNRDGTASISPSLTNTSGLSELQSIRQSLEGVRSIRISQGNISYSDINAYISTVDSMIKSKENSISGVLSALENLLIQIQNITNQLKMENNFTNTEWVELNKYFRYDTVQENAYVITDVMSQEEKQNVRQELLEYGELILSKSCFPKYSFEISSVNFLALIEYQIFQEQFELGTTFTLQIDEEKTVTPLLLGVHINFDDLSDFTLKYGNSTNLEEGFDFSAYRNSVNAGTTLSFDMVKLEAMKKQKDEVANFLNGSLIAATNNLKSTEDYTKVLIDENGIRLREYDFDSNKQLPYEAWWTGSLLAFSDDNFTTSKLALGRLQAPGAIGGYFYGLNAEVIGGNMLIGNNLYLTNEKNTFSVDENGATLLNAKFTIDNSKNKIVLDPIEGISIYKGTEKQLYLGTDGNVYFKGSMTAGSININNQFTVDTSGNVEIKRGSINIGNGQFTVDSGGYVVCNDIRIRNGVYSSSNLDINSSGKITSSNGYFTNGYFRGDIYAESGYFNGELSSSVVYTGKISANQINGGTINGITINGVTINGGTINGVNINTDHTIKATNGEITFLDNVHTASINTLGITNALSVKGKNVYSTLNDLEYESGQHYTRWQNLEKRVAALEKK